MTGMSGLAPAKAAVTHGYLLGDADDSGNVNMKDILLVRKYVAGICREKDIDLLSADANESGGVEMKDILLIRKAVAGLLTLGDNNSDGLYKVDVITVGGKNISRYTVVVDETNECMKYSAGELVKYINLACGVTLSVTSEKDAPSGYKIKYVFDTEDEHSLGNEGYRVFVDENGDVVFVCGALRGPLYATFFFLEEVVGWRFFMGDYRRDKNYNDNQLCDFEKYLYEAECVNMDSDFDVTEMPTFSYRAVSQSGSVYANFPMLRLNAVDAEGSRACGYAKFGFGVGTTLSHAHSYAMFEAGWGNSVPDKLNHEQPCLTDDDFYEKTMDYIVKHVDQKISKGKYVGEEFTQVSCSPNDNTNFCQCTDCKRIYEIEGSIAGTVFRFSNRVAEVLDEKYPGLEVYTVAYWDARNPPKMTRPMENVCVMYCIAGCNNHSYANAEDCTACGGNERLTDSKGRYYSNENEMEYLKGWAELTDNITIWYYSATFTYSLAPCPNILNIYGDYSYLASIGCTGVYSEGNFEHSYCFENLRGYLTAKMLWNANMTEEEFYGLLDEYLMIHYGGGWKNIRKYIDMADECSKLNGCYTNGFDRPWNMYNKEYFAEHYEEMRNLFVDAFSFELTDAQKDRLTTLFSHVEFLGLSAIYESNYVNGTEEQKKEYAERYADLVTLICDNGIEVVSFDITLPGGSSSFPTDVSDIRDPMTWIMPNFTGYWSWNGTDWA